MFRICCQCHQALFMEKGILTGLVVLTVMVFIKAMVVNMLDYVFHVGQDKDQSTIEDIQRCISAAYFDMNQNDASDIFQR